MPDNTFDFVYSNSVLEHVQYPKKVILESLRVLKPNGILFFSFPNYNTFYEGHYKIFWLPFVSKKWAKVYLRLIGKKPDFIDSLNFLTPKWCKSVISEINNIEIVTPPPRADWEIKLTPLYEYWQRDPYAVKRVNELTLKNVLLNLLFRIFFINKTLSIIFITILAKLIKLLGWNHMIHIVIKRL